MLEHGGRLQRAALRYGIAAEQWLDLSTGISPFAWPVPSIPASAWHRLPEDDDGLIDIACAYYAAPQLLPVAGSQAAIQGLPRLRAHSRVGVIAPGYSEHAHAWREAGHSAETLPADALFANAARFDVIVLIHPNNPGGDTFDRDALLQLHAQLAARGGWLIVDEAFIDATPERSLAASCDREGLIVLRSVGKFFGLAGARAGFVCAAPRLLASLRERLGPWTLAGPARHVLKLALSDRDWQRQQREQLLANSRRLATLLSGHGLTPSAGCAFFQWRRDERAAALHDALARRGILTRLFDVPVSLRLGLPGDEAAFARLDSALREIEPLSLGGEAARLRAAGSRADERPRAMPEGRGVGRGEGSAKWDCLRSDSRTAQACRELAACEPDSASPDPHLLPKGEGNAKARVLMVQGCTSDAGKSTLVAALCRWLHRRGVVVAPFKPQNMALNSAVTVDGGEIGRAQALQAQAAGLPPHTDFNPVLLKPNTDTGAQVIVHGRAVGNMDAVGYHDYKRVAFDAVLLSHGRLVQQYDAVIVEGAGSPAEINLRDRDIANMGYAEAVDCPVILIADIDRGGVFAHLVGTLALLSDSERARIAGFVINRFRGDMALLQSGLDWLERETGKPVLGVLPYLHGLHVDAEDALPIARGSNADARLRVAVPALPRISNHTDFDALRAHPLVDLHFVGPGEAPPSCDLIVLPGSKSTRADLAWLRAQGWEAAITRHLRYGGKLIGICGGFQMLGHAVHDPSGLEGEAGSSAGLGLLDFVTTLEPEKQLRNAQGRFAFVDAAVRGYEIHCGVSTGPALASPAVVLDGACVDGAVSEDGQIFGSYLHGLFDEPAALNALLGWAGLDASETVDLAALREVSLERLADAVDAHLDTRALLNLLEQTATCTA